jgi:hypothetical protein
MSMVNVPNIKLSVFSCTTVFTILLLLAPILANAEDRVVTQATLLDRIQIEDMLVRYYFDLSSGKSHDLAQYYTEGAILDVNGIISTGRKEIEKLYAGLGSGEESDAGGRGHMLLTNPIISVDGNTATAWVIWTGIANEDLKKPPRFLEQGREYDELVKIDSRWYIQKRYITSDSGLTERWGKNYKPRSFR